MNYYRQCRQLLAAVSINYYAVTLEYLGAVNILEKFVFYTFYANLANWFTGFITQIGYL